MVAKHVGSVSPAEVKGYEVNTLWLPLDKAEEFLKTFEEE